MIHNTKNLHTFLMALEGPDRLGKSTQAKLLADALSPSKYQFESCVVKIPYKDVYTYDRIYEMLFSGEAVEHPEVFQSFQALNRHIFQKDTLPKLASTHDLVILDRWNLSTKAYGTSGGVSVAATDSMLKGIEEPDLTFVFDGEPFAMDTEKDSYEEDNDFQARVRSYYKEVLDAESPRFVRVDAHRPISEVTDDLLSRIDLWMDTHRSHWA